MSVDYDIKCSACQNPLSIFPIFHSITTPLVFYCGRWNCRSKTLAQKCVRSITHEEIFAEQIFSCAYQSKGCLEELLPIDLEMHEEHCSYGFEEEDNNYLNLIPVLCQFRSAAVNFPSILRNNVEKFENYLDVFTGERVFNISRNHMQFFILTTDQHDRFAVFASLSDPFEDFQAEFAIKIVNTDKDNFCVKRFTMHVIHDNLNKTQIDVAVTNVIPVILSEGKGFKFRIEIAKVEQTNYTFCKHETNVQDVDIDLLAMLKCGLCKSYLRSNIHQCLEGHSFCEDCYQGLPHCTVCKNDLDERNNCVLEDLMTVVTFPCENSNFGCNFADRIEQLDRHICSFAPKKCVFENYSECTWTGRYEELFVHISDQHRQFMIKNDESLTINMDRRFLDGGYKSCYVLAIANFVEGDPILRKIYFLHVLYENKTFYWALEGQQADVVILMSVREEDSKELCMVYRKICPPFSGTNVKENACVIVDLNVLEIFCPQELEYQFEILTSD